VFINDYRDRVVNVYVVSPGGYSGYFPGIGYGNPWGFPDGLADGDYFWSAGYDDAYYGGGGFRVSGGIYTPFGAASFGLEISYPGYVPLTLGAGEWYQPYPDCGYVIADSGDYYILPNDEPLVAQPDGLPTIVEPVGWTPNLVTEAPQAGPPPQFQGVIGGKNPDGTNAQASSLVPADHRRQYALTGIVLVGGLGLLALVVGIRRRRGQGME